MFAGVETTFTKSGANLLSSTFLAVCLGLTYLCVDPIMKAWDYGDAPLTIGHWRISK